MERRPSPKGCCEAARLKRSEVIDPETGEPVTGTDVYDWKNRLIRRTTTEGRIIDITYDATGDRVTKSTGISKVHYLVDRNNLTGYAQVVEELNSSLTVERAYIYGLDLIAQSQLMPPEDPAEWQISYYLYDGLGTVRGLADATGLVTDAYFYDAYGVPLNVIGHTPNAYLYTGEHYDPDLGMYFLRARYLNPNTGRFHTMDTFEGVRTDPESLHKYLYAHANPVMLVDYSGNEWNLPSLSVVTAQVGLLARIAVVRFLQGPVVFAANRAAYWIFSNLVKIELGLMVAELGLYATDRMAEALLSNTEEIEIEDGSPGAFVERKVGANANEYRKVDHIEANEDGGYHMVSIKSKTQDTPQKLFNQIESEVQSVGNHGGQWKPRDPNSGFPSYPNSAATSREVLVAIPENNGGILRNSWFRENIRSLARKYQTMVRVVPLRGWRTR